MASVDVEHDLASERVRITRIVSRLRASGGEPSGVGRRIFPLVVFLGGAVILLLVVRGRSRPGPDVARPNTRALATAAAGLGALLLLLEPLGFVVASTAMFAIVAWALRGGPASGQGPAEAGPSRFGSPGAGLGKVGPSRFGSFGAGLGIGLLFSVAVYLAFTRGLGLALPAGFIWTWMR
ncbi:MAG: tripartite tricarboxylate transporter TctB family protein [Steroidobacteraceae bacterium]